MPRRESWIAAGAFDGLLTSWLISLQLPQGTLGAESNMAVSSPIFDICHAKPMTNDIIFCPARMYHSSIYSLIRIKGY
jgi:hypothetical protein